MLAPSMVTAQAMEMVMAKDESAKRDPELPGVPEAPVAFDELEWEKYPSFDMGVKDGFFLKHGRRCSVSAAVIQLWTVNDFRAYQRGLAEGRS